MEFCLRPVPKQLHAFQLSYRLPELPALPLIRRLR